MQSNLRKIDGLGARLCPSTLATLLELVPYFQFQNSCPSVGEPQSQDSANSWLTLMEEEYTAQWCWCMMWTKYSNSLTKQVRHVTFGWDEDDQDWEITKKFAHHDIMRSNMVMDTRTHSCNTLCWRPHKFPPECLATSLRAIRVPRPRSNREMETWPVGCWEINRHL